VALVGEANVGSQAREVALAARESLERGACSKPHAVTRDRVASRRMEDAAEVVGRDRQSACEL
jgi:hypothetical protein